MKIPGGNMKTTKSECVLALTLALVAGETALQSDEGMWLYTDPPRRQLQDKYGFKPSDAWLEHVRQSSVRFNSGGSGSFVSADGLIISNHHVGADSLQKFGDEQHNYYRDGFFARTRAEEKKCLDLELNVLLEIEDVTDRVNRAVKTHRTPEEAFAARRAVMAAIEKESLEKTGLRSDVVTLYQGGRYHLYRFKKYTDVRLVFAPEQQIAFFGGDPDNFEFPRFDLDICFFRAYENGRPAKVPHFLQFSATGPVENELVFVSGHPGHTSRSLTVDELAYLRDQRFPYAMQWLNRQEVMLIAYSARNEESARRAKEMLFGVQNSRKAREGMLAGLLDPQVMARKQADETRLRQSVAGKPEMREALPAWDNITAAGHRRLVGCFDDVDEVVLTHHRVLGDGPKGHRPEQPPVQPVGKRSRFQQHLVPHRPHLAAVRGRKIQAQWRPAPRVPRFQPRIAGTGAVLRGAAV